MGLAGLSIARRFGAKGFEILKKIKGNIDRNNPAYKDVYKDLTALYDCIFGMTDAMNQYGETCAKLIHENEALKKELSELKKVKQKEASFAPVRVSAGVHVMVKKEEPGESADLKTWYCPECISSGETGHFKYNAPTSMGYLYICDACKTKIVVSEHAHSEYHQK